MAKLRDKKSLSGHLAFFVDTLVHDVRFALRQIVRRPGFSVLVVLTLAVGIGGSAAIFSVLKGVVLRALPYAESGSAGGCLGDAARRATGISRSLHLITSMCASKVAHSRRLVSSAETGSTWPAKGLRCGCAAASVRPVSCKCSAYRLCMDACLWRTRRSRVTIASLS